MFAGCVPPVLVEVRGNPNLTCQVTLVAQTLCTFKGSFSIPWGGVRRAAGTDEMSPDSVYFILNSEAQSTEYSVKLRCHLQPKSREESCVLNENLKISLAASQAEPVALAKCKHLQIRNNVRQNFQSQLPSVLEIDQLSNHTPPTTFPDLSQDILRKFLCSIKNGAAFSIPMLFISVIPRPFKQSNSTGLI